MNKHSGVFITLEGLEGAGKSTHMAFIANQLRKSGREIVISREPGGTPLGEQIRHILLLQQSLTIDGMAELLLMVAARTQHIREVIAPALDDGRIVLCDRFTDSSYAYQGGGRGISAEVITQLVRLVKADLQPHLTLLFDVPVATGLARAGNDRAADRFERESYDFFQAVRNTYLKIATAEPERVKIINTDTDIETVHAGIMEILQDSGLC